MEKNSESPGCDSVVGYMLFVYETLGLKPGMTIYLDTIKAQKKHGPAFTAGKSGDGSSKANKPQSSLL